MYAAKSVSDFKKLILFAYFRALAIRTFNQAPNTLQYKLVFSLFFCFLLSFSVKGQSPFNNTWEINSQTLAQKWELDSVDRKGSFRVQSYKPIYISLGRWSDYPNTMPKNKNAKYAAANSINLNNFEAKFQISLKSKLWQGIFGNYGDLWAAFTQTAYWQVYNTEISRPFRELNYQPELLLVFPLKMKLLGFDLRYLGTGLNHQSNGRMVPLSRSWNRVTFAAAFERDYWQVTIRPWVRLPDADDENPEITSYIGRAELNVTYQFKKQSVYAIITTPFDKINRGSLQLNYVFPVRANLRLHLQVFTGYGETLIDYNHNQTTIGLGISFFDW